jgi:uncharacterized protein YjbI with pentapeptide repeats
MQTPAAALAALAVSQREGRKSKFPAEQFSGADLSSSDLRGLVVRGTKVSPRQFEGAKFDGANLLDATFSNVMLDGASFKGANLAEVKFIGCLLVDVDLTDANLSGVTFEDCRLGRAKFPQDIRAKFKNCRLIDVDLSGRDLRLSSFTRCTLWGTRFENCDLRSTLFSNCDTGSKRIGVPNFTGADLLAASMTPMFPLPVGMNALTLGGVTYALVRSSSGKVNVWSETTEQWAAFDKVEIPESVAAIIALMAAE